MPIKQDLIAAGGELIGTTMFLFLDKTCLGGIKTAQNSETVSQQQTAGTIALSNQTILFISTSMGFSLLVTAWIFYRITGGLFNPAITLALWFIGGVESLRAVLLVIAQLAGGILGAGLVALLTPYGGVENTITTLAPFVNVAQGLFMEAFLTAVLVFSVLMLAAEKHKATFIAPIGIGLVLFVCQLLGTLWTGCGMNPARSLGPSVISASFPSYHWIYWIGPLIGSLISVTLYTILKLFDYGSVVLGQDSDNTEQSPSVVSKLSQWSAHHGLTRHQRDAMAASGMKKAEIDKAERGMMQGAAIVEEQQAANTANGQADGMLAPPIEAQGRPEMSTRPSHVQQTMPNGQVGYVRQDSARGPSRGSQREYMLLNLAPILLSIRLSQMPEDRILVLWLPLQRIDLHLVCTNWLEY